MPPHHSPSGVTLRAATRKHPPPFDPVRPSSFSSNLSWGRPTARLRAWRRSHPRILAQQYLKPYRPPPPVPVDNGVCRSNGTWVIPMRRNLLLRRGRGDCGQPCFSEPAPTSATPTTRNPHHTLDLVSCEVVDEENIAFVSGLQVDENQPTGDDGMGIKIAEEPSTGFDPGMDSAEDQPANNESDRLNHPADRSASDSSGGPRGMASGHDCDNADCYTSSNRPESHLVSPYPNKELHSATEQEWEPLNNRALGTDDHHGPTHDGDAMISRRPDDDFHSNQETRKCDDDTTFDRTEDYCDDQNGETYVVYNDDAAYHVGLQ